VLLELVTEDEPEPHPEWTAAIRPTPADIMRAISVLGWTPPGGGYFEPMR
jgi:hypothetical protein